MGRTVLLGVAAAGLGGAVGGLWVGNRLWAGPPGPSWTIAYDASCYPNQRCGMITAHSTGTTFCQTAANCRGNNDGTPPFPACISDPGENCVHMVGSTKGCGGTCQDYNAGPCQFTVPNCP